MESMTGRLLVATPTLKDPNFDRTVVLLVAHEAPTSSATIAPLRNTFPSKSREVCIASPRFHRWTVTNR